MTMSLLYYRGAPGRIPKTGDSIRPLGGVEMYASTLLSCRTSGRPPKREGARPPLFSTHRSKPCRLRPEGGFAFSGRAAPHPAYRSPQPTLATLGNGPGGNSRAVRGHQVATACHQPSPRMRPAVPPWWGETTDSHTPLGGRYRTGGEFATANFAELPFLSTHSGE